jgi:hypothetical protein
MPLPVKATPDVPLSREELVSRREAAVEGKVKEALEFKQEVRTLLYSTLLCSTLLYSTLLYSTLLYSTLLYSTVQH